MTVVGERIIVQDLGGDAGLRWIEGAQSQFNSGELPLPGRIAARPVALGEGLVVPLSIGQVFLIDVVHGEPIAAPFQPMIHPDRFPDWTAAAAADPPRSFAIADRGQRVYLLELEGDPPVLVPAAQSPDLPRPITGELCATPHAVFAAAGNRLLAYGLPDLAEREAVLFDERIVWGPYKAGDLVLLATADERLHCFAPDGRLLAEASLPAPAVGRPLAADDSSVILAAEDGTLLMADARVGTVAVLGTFGEPLAAGPIRLDGRLYAVTPDGVLVSLPSNLPATLAAASAQR
jgi:hypothetical protein